MALVVLLAPSSGKSPTRKMELPKLVVWVTSKVTFWRGARAWVDCAKTGTGGMDNERATARAARESGLALMDWSMKCTVKFTSELDASGKVRGERPRELGKEGCERGWNGEGWNRQA